MEFKGAANVFDFSDTGFNQLDGAKAVQDKIVERVAIEGSLIVSSHASEFSCNCLAGGSDEGG